MNHFRIKAAVLISLLALQLGGVVNAQISSTTIQAVVPNMGQGTGQPAQLNVAQDQTQQFEYRYGSHSQSDIITSDLVLGVFLLFMLVLGLMVGLDIDAYVHRHRLQKPKKNLV